MRRQKRLLFILALSILFRIFISTSIYSGDVNNHIAWGEGILKYGFSGGYDREYPGVMKPTYPPLSIFSFVSSTGLYHLVYDYAKHFNNQFSLFPSTIIWGLEDQNVLPAFNKAFSILADIGIGLLIYRFTKKLWATVLYLFNPAVWYLSSLWGQLESGPLFFLLLSLFLLIRKKINFAHLAFAAALLSKQSTIIYLPIFLLISYRKSGVKQTFIGLVVQLTAFILSYVPFMTHVDLLMPFQIYIDRLQTGSGSYWITDHAFNFWALITRSQKVPDSTPILFGISALAVGLIIFSAFTVPLFIKLYKHNSTRLTFLACALLPMFSFLFLTKMHERYFAPVIPFLLISAVLDPVLIPIYFLASFAHLANIWHEWYFPRITPLDTWVSNWSSIELFIFIFIISTLFTMYKFYKYKNAH